jgi:predicted transcriptional regulator
MHISKHEKRAINILELLKLNQRDFTVAEIMQVLSIDIGMFYKAIQYLILGNYVIRNNTIRPAVYKYNIERDKVCQTINTSV